MWVRCDLPEPTPDLAEAKIQQFEDDNRDLESGLRRLIEWFPRNEDLGQVLVKIAAINGLYNTQIRSVYRVGEVIRDAKIDPLLREGRDEVIPAIAQVEYAGGIRLNFYSFATKYANWHPPKRFPIYDSRVAFCLRCYQAKDGFAGTRFTWDDLWDYAKFRGIVETFRRHYRLEFGWKKLDQFLYQAGGEYFRRAAEKREQAGSERTGSEAARSARPSELRA